jgi:hypothetical protein
MTNKTSTRAGAKAAHTGFAVEFRPERLEGHIA